MNPRFPRTQRYHPEWIAANVGGGAPVLALTEWLGEALDLKPGMRVLDLGCGFAASSIFLHREYGVQVWAVDLWKTATENFQRIRDAGAVDHVFPLHADARALPFAAEFFDAVVCVDSIIYFGTDDLYLNYLANFVKPGGLIAHVGAGLVQDVPDPLPDHLRLLWTQDCHALHTPAWWRRHWERTGIVAVETADGLPDGWKHWIEWHEWIAPDNHVEINAIRNDAGRHLGYVRVVGRRVADVKLEPYCWPDTLRTMHPALSVPPYEPKPLLRETA